MTNQQLYDLWKKKEATLLAIFAADYHIDWEIPNSPLAHEAKIEYNNQTYWIVFSDGPNGTKVINPDKLAK